MQHASTRRVHQPHMVVFVLQGCKALACAWHAIENPQAYCTGCASVADSNCAVRQQTGSAHPRQGSAATNLNVASKQKHGLDSAGRGAAHMLSTYAYSAATPHVHLGYQALSHQARAAG